MQIITSLGGTEMFRKKIIAADMQSIGTTFYHVTEDDVNAALKEKDANIFIRYMFKQFGWDCLDMVHNLFGSAIIDGDMYICVSDGKPINVDDYEVDPNQALKDLDIDDLEEYIEEGTPDIIKRYITPHELDKIDVDEISIELLEDGYTLKQVYNAAIEGELIL